MFLFFDPYSPLFPEMFLLFRKSDCFLLSEMKEIEGLHGCYLLHSNNPRFKGRPYIGYTVDPVRRIGQHNGGTDKGGARRIVD